MPAIRISRKSKQPESTVHTINSISSLTLFVVALGLSAILSGCVTVQPWERGRLADPMMVFDENPIEKGIKEHAKNYREGSVGGTGAQGGGCGCG